MYVKYLVNPNAVKVVEIWVKLYKRGFLFGDENVEFQCAEELFQNCGLNTPT